jgi:bacterioferritin
MHLLNAIMEAELAGMVRYTHYSLMVTDPNRIPIVQFLKAQASESLLHAQQVGEIITGLDGHASLRVGSLEQTFRHSIYDILLKSLNHEKPALTLYKNLLDVVTDASVYLEEDVRGMIGQEELYGMEPRKMLRDFSRVEGYSNSA